MSDSRWAGLIFFLVGFIAAIFVSGPLSAITSGVIALLLFGGVILFVANPKTDRKKKKERDDQVLYRADSKNNDVDGCDDCCHDH